MKWSKSSHNSNRIARLADEWGVLAVILVVAAYLRLGYLDLTSFRYDEAFVCNQAAKMLDGE
ncbi:MAG: hypothetical protein M1370_05580, partial [Bacteroidetes bacterium]|nr:hypothetical protein [Bacteroidota bacterium]